MSHRNPLRALHAAPASAPTPAPGSSPDLAQQSWVTSAAEQASDALTALRTVEVPVGALRAALLILADLVVRPGESEEMRTAAGEVCAVFAALTDLPVAPAATRVPHGSLMPVH
ncbi:hypothetical protein AB0D08_25350 [Kitasatospora sp. NPDC048540]|uniref:hypothetical protein n=1 Tax=unclassified Kitasatospora TaxID=2633591 RepID=UPI00053BA213|nr:hypothetical protein [Kitasatospora sp. MBT63]